MYSEKYKMSQQLIFLNSCSKCKKDYELYTIGKPFPKTMREEAKNMCCNCVFTHVCATEIGKLCSDLRCKKCFYFSLAGHNKASRMWNYKKNKTTPRFVPFYDNEIYGLIQGYVPTEEDKEVLCKYSKDTNTVRHKNVVKVLEAIRRHGTEAYGKRPKNKGVFEYWLSTFATSE